MICDLLQTEIASDNTVLCDASTLPIAYAQNWYTQVRKLCPIYVWCTFERQRDTTHSERHLYLSRKQNMGLQKE